jgi:hypothetical protein
MQAKPWGALPEHAAPVLPAATTLHSSPPKKAVLQSKALIKGMVGPYLALGVEVFLMA